MNRSFYCRKCQLLVDQSEVEKEEVLVNGTIVERFTHVLMAALTVSGDDSHVIHHEVIPEP